MAKTSLDPQRVFRNALGNFATGVTVVSGLLEQQAPFGATINSFSAVSLEPRLVLFSLRKEAACLACFTVGESFAVSVLGAQHADVSSHFATSKDNKWASVPHVTWDTGCPILVGALAAFEGEVHSQYEAGDHVVIFGRVHRLAVNPSVEPLIFFRGRYAGLRADAASAG